MTRPACPLRVPVFRLARVTVLAGLALAVAAPAPAAEPPRSGAFEEAGRWIDRMADQLRDLGIRLEGQLQAGRAQFFPGLPEGWPWERPLITIMLHHRAELGLTPDQVGRLEALRADYAREAIRRDAELRIAELDLAGLLEREPADMARVEVKVREIGQLRAEVRLARIRAIEQGKAVLTGEQRARLQALLRGMAGPPAPPAGAMPAPPPPPGGGARL